MMVLGLAVNLANRLRQASLERQTRQQLRQLTAAVVRYRTAHAGQLPDVTPLVDPAAPVAAPDAAPQPAGGAAPAEATLQAAARRNRDDVQRALGWPTVPASGADPLRDPWGTPIVLMPRQNPLIGMAPGDEFFFVSAGPDRQFSTRADNLYSYDYADDAPTAKLPPATRSP